MTEEKLDQPDADAATPPDSSQGWNGEERRVNNMHAQNTARLDALEGRTTKLEDLVAEGNADTKTLLEIVRGTKQGIRFGIAFSRYLSIFAQWVIPILGVIGIYLGWRSGKWPGPQ